MQSDRRAELYATLALARVRVTKVLALVRHPTAWLLAARGLRQGVFASFEHADVAFGAAFRTVVDVGSSTGQFALFALWRFPEADLICFEPLPGSAAVAERVLPGARARVHQVAVGSEGGTATLHVSAQEDSSSLLPIGPGQVAVFPGTGESGRITVPVVTLSTHLDATSIRRPCLLKIDVQGFEREVLAGSAELLDAVDEILVECSFVELYEGQGLASEVISGLAGRGFALVDVRGVSRGLDGRAVQADFLFSRTSSSEAARRSASEGLSNGEVNGSPVETSQTIKPMPRPVG